MKAVEAPEGASTILAGQAENDSHHSRSEQVDLPEAEARALTDRLKVHVDTAWDLVEQAYNGRAWISLGYTSWDAYVATEFPTSRFSLPREERREAVASLREAGLTFRAISAATGSSVGTVAHDLTVTEQEAPTVQKRTLDAPVVKLVGLDGKARPAKAAITVRRKQKPLVDSYMTAVYKLVRAVESVERLHHDKRFAANRAALSACHRNELGRASNMLLNLIDDLDLDGGKR